MASIVYNPVFKEHRIEYKNSSAVVLDSRSSVGGSILMIFGETFLNVTFSGTSISIYGDSISSRDVDVGPVLDSKNALIDDAPVTFAQSNSGSLYKSPKLSQGLHSLYFPNISNVYIDSILVKPGNQTDIFGETLLVDDRDSSLLYEGSWTQCLREDAGHDPIFPVPTTNSTMRSDSPGASVSFPFTGTAVSVFGFCEQEKAFLNVDVYLDGVLTPTTISNSSEIRQTVSPCFSVSGLSETNHTLKLELNNNSAPGNLSIDFFSFVSSSRSFATKSITNTNSTAPVKELIFNSTSTSSPSIKPSGARLAGLIFGVIGIALFIALLILRRRIFKRRIRPPPEVAPFALGGRRKDVTVEQTPRQQQRNLPPNNSDNTSSSILNKEASLLAASFVLGGRRKDVPVEQTPRQQRRDLPPNTSDNHLRGILKKEAESKPMHETKKTLSPETKRAILEKLTRTKTGHIIPRVAKETSSQQPLDQTSPV